MKKFEAAKEAMETWLRALTIEDVILYATVLGSILFTIGGLQLLLAVPGWFCLSSLLTFVYMMAFQTEKRNHTLSEQLGLSNEQGMWTLLVSNFIGVAITSWHILPALAMPRIIIPMIMGMTLCMLANPALYFEMFLEDEEEPERNLEV